jgi:hypothetical protein
MAYNAKVFNIMIASPSDVEPERSIVREVIHEWNVIHSEARKIALLPVGWETHVSPEMGSHPQEIINNRILEKSDVLVGVFWTRIGTNTGKYLSGTVEEIEKHIQTGKPTMLYFSNKPAHPDSIDQEQYSKLKEFKQSCQSRGLYETYDSLNDFKNNFFRHLQIKLNEDVFFSIPNTEQIQDNHIEESDMPIPKLSEDAISILREASQDKNGVILHIRGIGSTSIQTGGKNLISEQSPRIIAKWESALKELVSNELIVDRGYKGEVFEITDKGYRMADMVKP